MQLLCKMHLFFLKMVQLGYFLQFGVYDSPKHSIKCFSLEINDLNTLQKKGRNRKEGGKERLEGEREEYRGENQEK